MYRVCHIFTIMLANYLRRIEKSRNSDANVSLLIRKIKHDVHMYLYRTYTMQCTHQFGRRVCFTNPTKKL